MAGERLLLRDAIGGFAPGQGLRASLLLTFSFDGTWIEEGLVPDLFDRQVGACLVIRDGNALIREAPSVRYHRANAQFSTRVFHSKLILLVAVVSLFISGGGFRADSGSGVREIPDWRG